MKVKFSKKTATHSSASASWSCCRMAGMMRGRCTMAWPCTQLMISAAHSMAVAAVSPLLPLPVSTSHTCFNTCSHTTNQHTCFNICHTQQITTPALTPAHTTTNHHTCFNTCSHNNKSPHLLTQQQISTPALTPAHTQQITTPALTPTHTQQLITPPAHTKQHHLTCFNTCSNTTTHHPSLQHISGKHVCSNPLLQFS